MDFIEKLRTELQKPLPGKNTQLGMAAGNRVFYNEIINNETPKKGSVLIILYPKNSEWNTIFIKRTNDKGPHSGQMAFPGGMIEPEDHSLYETALREAKEEVGINPMEVDYIGELTPLHIPVSNIIVHPFIGMVKDKPNLVLSPDEVEDILECPLSVFLDPKILSEFSFEFKGNKYKAPSFVVKEYTIWGATAMMWNEFLTVYKRIVENGKE